MTSGPVAMRDQRNRSSQVVLSPSALSRDTDATTISSALLPDEHASRCAAPSSPTTVHDLPQEILSEIFLHRTSDYPPSSRNLGTPTIARVCQEWRAVAFGYPQLWTIVNIHDANISPHDDVEAYLARSCHAPLSVYAEAPSANTYYDGIEEAVAANKRVADALYRVAALSAHRWKMVSVIGDCILFSRQSELNTPLLERAVLMAKSWVEQFHAPLPLAFVKNAPRMKAATLAVGYDQHPVTMPSWSRQLTSMVYVLLLGEACEFDTIIRHLSAQPHLRRLKVLDDEIDGYGGFALPDIHLGQAVFHLPKLVVMAVSGLGHLLLPQIDAPVLKKLTITDGVEVDGDGFVHGFTASLNGLLERSSRRSLRTLELINIGIDEHYPLDDLYRCLETLPALAALRIEDRKDRYRPCHFLRPGLLIWLARNESAPARLPRLTHLTLRFGGWGFDGCEDLVRQIMVSRATSGVADGIPFKALARFVCDLGREFQLP
ncbi:hypothetical protein GGF50DRAFT_59619 [Schizophyllum commune]